MKALPFFALCDCWKEEEEGVAAAQKGKESQKGWKEQARKALMQRGRK